MATAWWEQLRSIATRARLFPDAGTIAGIVALVVVAFAVSGPLAALAGAIGVIAGLKLGRDNLDETDAPSDDRSRRPQMSRHRPNPVPPGREADWRYMIDALPVAVVATDRDHIVVHANQTARDIFGSLRVGAPLALASRAPELADALTSSLLSREPRAVRLHERMPVERRLDVTVTPLRNGEADLPALLIVLNDISERDRLAQMRADFIAHASHELRTPLTALRGFIETLQGAAKNDVLARERFLAIMSSEAMRMTRILDDLLQLTRVEMRAHIPPTGRVGVNEVLAEIVESLEPIAAAVETTIQVETPPEESFVRGDRDEVVQVLVNILQNAIKYGRPGGAVTVRVSRAEATEGSRIRIAIADDGPGIAEEHLPRLTERFYRVDDKTSREKGGTGLGLAIVKHILTRHRGELAIASRVGTGSTFTIELPVDDRE